MTILAAYDPQTLDRAPIRFAVAAARFANVPLVVASVRAGITPAACALDDLLDDELARVRSDLARDRAIDVRTRVVEASTPAGVAGGLQSVIDQEQAELRCRGLDQARRDRPDRSRDHGPARDQRLRMPRGRRPQRPQPAAAPVIDRRRVRSDAGGSARAARRRHHRPDGRRGSARPHRGEARDRRRCLRRPSQGRRRAQPRRARSHGRRRHRRARPRRTSGERGAGR